MLRDELERGLSALRGKTIAHVVLTAGRAPRSQVFLVFTDGTYYEFFSDSEIEGLAGLYPGGLDEVRRISGAPRQIVFEL